MAIDYQHLKQRAFAPVRQHYSERDTMLYALSLGLGNDPLDAAALPFVYEGTSGGLRTLPTQAVVLGFPGFWAKEPDTGIDWVKLLHGEQRMRIHRPLPPSCDIVGLNRVERITDKGAGKADEKLARKHSSESVGTGVVIVDTGVILTNLHVVAGATRITVVFADGHESEATVVGVRPEHDLAVLQARSIPDDLVAAAMRSSNDLAVGDMVVAVGFPFGIGPSTSSGVVSGLRREYQSPEGKQTIGNLIQFDAAANPGNSGGPLVTAEGEVVGIVTGILSPGTQRVFIGIGFAVPIESAASAAGVPPF